MPALFLGKSWSTGRRSLRLRQIPWLVLAAGLLLTALAGESQRRQAVEDQQRRDAVVASRISAALQARLTGVETLLAAVVGLFDATAAVDRGAYRRFFQALERSVDVVQGVQGVGYAAVVPPGGAEAFVQAQRRDGAPDFRLFPPGRRPLTTSIVYLEPLNWRNRRAVGFDMYTNPNRREAMDYAAKTGGATLSGPVRLVQEADAAPQVGVLLYRPVRSARPAAPGPRPAGAAAPMPSPLNDLRGWAYAPLRMGDFVRATLARLDSPEARRVGLRIYDGKQPRPAALLFDSGEERAPGRHGRPVVQSIRIGNRDWLVVVEPVGDPLASRGLTAAFGTTLLVGVAATLILALGVKLVLVRQLSAQQALLATVFETSPSAIALTDVQGVIITANAGFAAVTGYPIESIRGRNINLLESGEKDQEVFAEVWRTAIQRGAWQGELWNQCQGGERRRHALTISLVRDVDQRIQHVLVIFTDVTDSYQRQQRIRFMAMHDFLTGLPNRASLSKQLGQAISLARRRGSSVALIYLDLDGFKPVNDLHGHAKGDQLLQLVAQRLRESVRESDQVFRLGGDEFVLLVPMAPDLEQLRELAAKLQRLIAMAYPELGVEIRISASIGIALWPQHADDGDDLLVAADLAMYQAKEEPGRLAVAGPLSPYRSDLPGEGAQGSPD